MKKKNTAKKAVLPALLAVLCSTAALTSVSYAWFTMGNTAEVGDIQVDVQAADGLQISANAADWKSVLPTEELKNEELGNHFPTQFVPVSTVGTIEEGHQQMFVGTVEGNGNISAVLATTASNNQHYVYFDLYFKVDAAKELSLDAKSFVSGTNQAHLASRVSFVDLGCDPTGTPDKAKALNGMVGEENKASVVIWEPNAKDHTAAAINAGYAKQDEVLTYKGVADVIAKDLDAATYATKFAQVETVKPAYLDGLTTAQQKIADLEAGINKVRIYIWLEGQDVDCNNSVASKKGVESKVTTGLKFAVPKAQNA